MMSSGTLIASTSLRLLLGVWMVFWGLNHFTLFQPQPLGIVSHELHLAFIHSGLFAGAKVVEIMLGVALLANRFVPGMLVFGFPITVTVAYMDWMEHIVWVNLSGYIIFSVHVALLLFHLRYYTQLFHFRAMPRQPRMADLLPGERDPREPDQSAHLSGA
jgi:hypothetical protein